MKAQAVAAGYDKTLQILLKKGAKLEYQQDTSKTESTGWGLMHLAAHHNSPTRLAWLVSRGVDINTPTSAELETPLMIAAQGNVPHLVYHLLMRGARADLRDSRGNTALHWAARKGARHCLMMILLAGADNNVRMAQRARARAKRAAVFILSRALFSPRAQQRNLKFQTPAHIAKEMGHKSCFQMLTLFKPERIDAGQFLSFIDDPNSDELNATQKAYEKNFLALNTADNEDAAANLERSLERRQGRSKLPGIFRKKDRAQVYAA